MSWRSFVVRLSGLSMASWWALWVQHRPPPVIEDPAAIDAYFATMIGKPQNDPAKAEAS